MALSLCVVVIFTALGTAFLTRSLGENLIGHRSAARQAAFYLAEGGLDQASVNLRTLDDVTDDVLTNTLPTGTFHISNPPASLGNGRWQIFSDGDSQGEHARLEAIFELTPQSLFQFAMFGDQGVTVNGNVQTDSYNSQLGPYNSNPASPTYNQSQHGDVGTSSTTSGSIDLGSSVLIKGQLTVGPNVADPQSVVTGFDPSLVTANPKVVSATLPYPMPVVAVPFGLLCPDLTVSSQQTVTLSPAGGMLNNGTYCYRDLEVKGGGTLTASGPVAVYLTYQLTLRGNATVGVPSTPSNMLFLMAPTSDAVLQPEVLTGSSVFYGAIYGPEATIRIQGNASVFGSVIAKDVYTTGSASIHYDQALSQFNKVTNLYQRRLISWRHLQ